MSLRFQRGSDQAPHCRNSKYSTRFPQGLLFSPTGPLILEPRHKKTGILHIRKQRHSAVTAHLISVFAFATLKVKSLLPKTRIFQPLAIFCDRTVRFVSDLVGNPEDRFSDDVTNITSCRQIEMVLPSLVCSDVMPHLRSTYVKNTPRSVHRRFTCRSRLNRIR